MIDYSPFWITLQNSRETTYTLKNDHNMSGSTIDRLKNNKNITTNTINDLCRILDCSVQDILQYIHSGEDQVL